MAVSISLAGQPRDAQLTPKALRRAQKVPGVMYGRSLAARNLQFDYRVLVHAVRQAGTSHVVSFSCEGDPQPQLALVREVQRHPVTNRILHVDLYAIEAGQRIRSMVPLVQRGKAPAVALGAVVAQEVDSLEVECLLEDMPEAVEIDLEKLVNIHSRLTVADLVIDPKVHVLDPADTVVAHVIVQRMREVEAVAVAPVEGEAPKTEEATPQEQQPTRKVGTTAA